MKNNFAFIQYLMASVLLSFAIRWAAHYVFPVAGIVFTLQTINSARFDLLNLGFSFLFMAGVWLFLRRIHTPAIQYCAPFLKRKYMDIIPKQNSDTLVESTTVSLINSMSSDLYKIEDIIGATFLKTEVFYHLFLKGDILFVTSMDIEVKKCSTLNPQDMTWILNTLSSRKNAKPYRNYVYIVTITDAIWQRIFTSMRMLSRILNSVPQNKELPAIQNGIHSLYSRLQQYQKDWEAVNGLSVSGDSGATGYTDKCTELMRMMTELAKPFLVANE